MSRRRSIDRLEAAPLADVVIDEDTGQIQAAETVPLPWWYACEMPEPWGPHYLWHQWLAAWGTDTLKVIDKVWRNVGGRIYDIHRNALLRDDLQDWLHTEAFLYSARFVPDPWHEDPLDQWRSWLYGALRQRAEQHFNAVVTRKGGQEAADAYNRGILSTEYLAETGLDIGRYLHGHSVEFGDPYGVVVRLQDLAARVARMERADRQAGIYTTSSTTVGEVCLITGCKRPSIARGLCRPHYQANRRQQSSNCSEPGCKNPTEARGLCSTHYKKQRGACSEPGCARVADGARGLCNKHYYHWKRDHTS